MRELNKPVLIRRSTRCDRGALARLAALTGAAAAGGRYLLAEVGGTLVAAASLDNRTAPLHDPAYATADLRTVLVRWAHAAA